MKLSPEEEQFLRCWIYDEVHYQQGRGPAKQLQVEHQVAPVDLSVLIAAAIPEPADQEEAGRKRPPTEALQWPWSAERLSARLAEARSILAKRTPQHAPGA